MSNVERKPKATISVIWSDAVLDGEPARVSIVNGIARICIGWFDIHVPGKFDGCVDEVISAYKRQLEETEKAFRNLPDGWKDEPWEPPEGWVIVSEQDIQDLEDIPCDVIPLRQGDRNE